MRGRGSVRNWSLPVGRRNKALDQEVEALAELHILGQGFIRGLGARGRPLCAAGARLGRARQRPRRGRPAGPRGPSHALAATGGAEERGGLMKWRR